MTSIKTRLIKLESGQQSHPNQKITEFRCVPDDEWQQHKTAMIEADNALLRDENGFLLWSKGRSH